MQLPNMMKALRWQQLEKARDAKIRYNHATSPRICGMEPTESKDPSSFLGMISTSSGGRLSKPILDGSEDS